MPTESVLDHWPPILPTLQDSETLYSWCAAVHRRSISASVRETSKRLFGSPSAALLHDFPARLLALEMRTEGLIGSAVELAKRHSLLGFFLPFIEPEAALRYLDRVTAGSLPDIKMRLGIPASGVGGYHPLRCCKECVALDLSEVGRSTWRTYQQAPSTLVCAEHWRPLVQTWNRSSPAHRREWIAPDPSLSEGRHETVGTSDRTMEVLVRMASASRAVFDLPPGSLAPRSIGALHRCWASLHGALTAAGSIRHRTVLDQIEPEFRHIATAFAGLGPVACELDAAAIIGSVAREAPKPTHPAKHLAVLAAMFPDAEELIRELALVGASAETDDALTKSDVEMLPEAIHDNDITQQDFLAAVAAGASIRAAAQATGVSTTTGVRWARQNGIEFTARPKSINIAVLGQLRAELANGEDRSTVAQRHGISLTSVHRLLSTEHGLLELWRGARHETARRKHRQTLGDVVAANPAQSAKQIRTAAPASWAWLYRHDRSWLTDAMPSLWTAGSDSSRSR